MLIVFLLDGTGFGSAAFSAAPPPPLERDYRAALLAEAHDEDGLGVLLDLERKAATQAGKRQDLDSLREVELRVSRHLGGSALLPVVWLHLRAYRLYLSEEPRLATHTRLLLLDVIDRGLGDGERAAKARWLVQNGLAFAALESQGLATAESLFLRTLEEAPGEPAAGVGLGYVLEKSGNYDRAVTVLGSLPPDAGGGEALLRLAVNLRRIDRQNDAARVLKRLLASGGGAPWVREVAYEEWGRLLMETQDWRAAAELLDRGLDEIPSSEGIVAALAYAEERGGRYRASSSVAERLLGMDGTGAGPSPRDRYNSPPLELMTEELGQLEELARAGHGQLERELSVP